VGKGADTATWSKVAGRRSIFWSTRDWTMMVELAGVEPPWNFFGVGRKVDCGVCAED
jgi:hypothetical protein